MNENDKQLGDAHGAANASYLRAILSGKSHEEALVVAKAVYDSLAVRNIPVEKPKPKRRGE